MCLHIVVRAEARERASLELAASAAIGAGLHVHVRGSRGAWQWPGGRQEAVAFVSERGGCACSLLAEDADWDSSTWSMRPDILEPLAQTLKVLCERGPALLRVEALWDGDQPDDEVSVTADQLTAIARAGRLGTKTRYTLSRRVGAAQSQGR